MYIFCAYAKDIQLVLYKSIVIFSEINTMISINEKILTKKIILKEAKGEEEMFKYSLKQLEKINNR